jgi:hypothetical protein
MGQLLSLELIRRGAEPALLRLSGTAAGGVSIGEVLVERNTEPLGLEPELLNAPPKGTVGSLK